MSLVVGCKRFEEPTMHQPKFKVEWCYGKLDGSEAVEDPNTQIGNLKISGYTMSYSWTKGDLREWGLAYDTFDAMACVFFMSGGKTKWFTKAVSLRRFRVLGRLVCSRAFATTTLVGIRRNSHLQLIMRSAYALKTARDGLISLSSRKVANRSTSTWTSHVRFYG